VQQVSGLSMSSATLNLDLLVQDLVKLATITRYRSLRQRLRLIKHRLLRRLQDAIQPPQDDKRKNHLPILRLLVISSQNLRNRPDERTQALYFRLCGHVVHPLEQACFEV
jgi:hypothetical protein